MSDIRLGITADGPGIPLSMAGALLAGIGAVYPNTVMADTRRNEGMAVTIRECDYLNPADPDIVAPVAKDDPETLAFLSGFKAGDVTAQMPGWLSALLMETTDGMLEGQSAENYIELSLRHPGSGKWFSWIITKPGGESPHKLRRDAEARIAELESELAEARGRES